ncbi:MAG: Coenzyme F420 hydrogenase/dehydrogenase, beta subunit C-terminal domain [Desulfobacteraceae bacterium]|nr:Coenzyme F420 hydrogenase/dehydrogenase, beta subunit C-terminal domain [Desulfobacteraceae bacterium]
MKIFGSKELTQNVIEKDLCIGCGACMDLCPYFASHKGKTANLFACTLEQGRCYAYCPKVETDLEDLSLKIQGTSSDGHALGHFRSIQISKAGPVAKPGNFQCGGTVSALMAFGLKKGTLDAAVLTDREGVLPVPKLVTHPDEVYGCSGSKYTSAPTVSAVHRGIKQGYKKIGMVGTPCQVLASAKMRSNPMNDEVFSDPFALVIGLFCTWALDFRRFEPFISEIAAAEDIIKIDIPPPPAEIMELHTRHGKIEIPLEKVRKLVPEACGLCPDMTSEFADISVGVLEGRPEFNTLIIRSQRGEEMVHEAVKEGFLVLAAMPEESLDHLILAAGNKKKRASIKETQA